MEITTLCENNPLPMSENPRKNNMHFTVIREHREFFRKHHWIECAEVISAPELKRFSESIPSVLAERLKTGVPTPAEAFTFGHDIWRGAPVLKKMILNRNLAEIASGLI